MYLTIFFTLCTAVPIIVTGNPTLPPPFTEECVNGTYPPKGRPVVPTYTVNLDLPANQRWNEVVKNKGPQIHALLDQFKAFLLEFGEEMEFLIKFVDSDLGYLADTFPAPFGDEIKGIASATGLPLGEVVLYNIFYEVFTVCTSIVGQDSSGKLYHARNLDFGLFMGWNVSSHQWAITETLRPMIVNLNFTKGGELVYRSVNYAGYVGILTAIKPGILTFTMDERFNKDGGYVGILKWIMGDRSQNWMGFLTRQVMEQARSYDEAKDKLTNGPMLAPAYFILGGNSSGQACVITRGRNSSLHLMELNPSKGIWYLVETNYDNWTDPPFFDDRRTPAKNCLNKHTQNGFTLGGIFDVLSSKPVLNKLTTYTALMQVNSGHLETYLQYCPDPCWPW